MELQKQVCSLESAKRLKELGVNQESLYEWVEHSPAWNKHNPIWSVFHVDADDKVNPRCAAFTVAELGEMLPKQHQIYSYPTCVNGKEIWDCTSVDQRIHQTEGWEQGYSGTPPMFSDTEADARAKMLIYLLENKLI